MKRILSVILCLAVFLSSMVIGVISTASAEGAGEVATPSTTVTATGAPESVGTLEGVTAAAGELKADENGNYYLTGDITVDSADDLAAVKTALNAGKTFDGKGYTITTSVPFFDKLNGGTLKNFTVKGEIKATEANVVNLGQPGVGVIVCGVQKAEGAETATINFENINIAAKLSYSSAPAEGVSAVKNPHISGFVGFSLGVEIYFKDCAVTGYIGSTAADIESKVGGFIGRHQTNALGYFENCTMSAEVNAGGHFGGFIADQNSATKSATFKNCVVDLNVDNTYKHGTAYSGALIGYGRSVINVENCKVIGEAKLATKGNAPDRPFGGVIGRANGNNGLTITVDGFYFGANIKASDKTNGGGVIGVVADANAKKISINNMEYNGSFTYDAISGQDTFFGFAIGRINKPATDGIYFTNVRNLANVNITLPKADNTDVCIGILGRIDASGSKEVVFENCYNVGNITVNAYNVNTSARNNNVGGLVGLYHSTSPLTIKNCYNTGNLALYRYNVSASFNKDGSPAEENNYIGGLVACQNLDSALTIIDSYNTGDISGATRSDSAYVGGFVGATNNVAKNVLIENCYNTGDVTAIKWDGFGHAYDAEKIIADGNKDNGTATETAADPAGAAYAGGFIGGVQAANAGGAGSTTIKSSFNAGESVVATNELNTKAYAGGLAGALKANVAVESGYNVADVTLTTTAEGMVAGAIVGAVAKAASVTVDYSVNTGNDGATAIIGAVDVEEAKTITNTVNVETELPAYCTPDNTKSVNTKAYIALVFANIDAELASAYVADDFKGDKAGTVDRLNNLINPDVVFGVTFDKDLYDAIEMIVGDENVKVEGIVTFSKYVDKIGAFTHEALDAYYEANAEALAAKNVTKLYMDATREAANIGSGDLVDGDYFVNIRLIEGNAGTVATTYTARAFIQIGDLYIYSSIVAE